MTDGPFGPLTLTPGAAQAFQAVSGSGVSCKFTVDASPKKFRATAIYDNGLNYVVAIPAY